MLCKPKNRRKLPWNVGKLCVSVNSSMNFFCNSLYVGSIHFSLTEDDLRQIFEPFGPLEYVNLHKGREGKFGEIGFSVQH